MAPSVKNLAIYALRLAFFTVSNIYSLVAYMIGMTLLTPLRLWAPRLYWRIEHEVFYWLETVCVSWVTTGGYQVIECGDDISYLHDKNCLLLSNHQSTGDVPIVMLALHGKKMTASKLMWVIYKLYKWTNFGMVCQHREDFFIDVGKSVRDSETAKFKNHLVDSYLRLGKKWIMIFPEGGFLCRNQETSTRYAKKNNLPDLQHVLLPRVGAVKAVIDTVGEHFDEATKKGRISESSNSEYSFETPSSGSYLSIQTSSSAPLLHSDDPSHPVKWVLDMTVAYKDKRPLELLGMSIGYDPCKDVLIHWRSYRIKDIPRDEEGLTAWLYQRYIEKEEMLDNYYKDNKIPTPSSDSSFPPLQPRYLKFDKLYQVLVHLALFTLCYLQYFMIIKPIMSAIAVIFSYVFFFL